MFVLILFFLGIILYMNKELISHDQEQDQFGLLYYNNVEKFNSSM